MARTVDLTKLPPPQATCHACGRTVALDRRARRARKFRCPFCQSDNRVDARGLGWPLSGLIERVEHMPQARCRHCGATNRLPLAILQAGRYTCHQCRQVDLVPKILRQRAGIVSRAVLLTVFLATCLIVGFSLHRVARAAGRLAQLTADSGPVTVYFDTDIVTIREARQIDPVPAGRRFQATLTVFNPYDRPVSIFVRATVVYRQRSGASRVVLVRDLPSGERRNVTIIITDPERRPADGISLAVEGIT